MKYFWTHHDEIPEGQGYGQFSLKHFLWLAATVLFVAVITVLYKYSDPLRKLFLLRTIAALLIISDLIKMILIARSSVRLSEYLPLELCSFAAYSTVIDSLWPDNTILPVMLLTLFLPAAIMAVIFPTSSVLPAINFYTIHQFFYHGLIIAYVIARFACGEIPLTLAGVWQAIPRICILVAFMYLVDTVFDKNYMFLRDTYGNPMLEIIRQKAGDGVAYTAGLVCFAIIMIHVFFLIFKLIDLLFIR